ncbi:hypothetical protein KP77_13300 [Jeotgalibacillus alimentarius]|uniref:Uncharacterized protein n=1 Tax=Jeotgalibacillus alimentarius TaxID=135826 RepID=A0A0C2S9Q7_9BACL|nr:hypothetical protein KP77_13300 [Jeotgalibacillus alimentarius]
MFHPTFLMFYTISVPDFVIFRTEKAGILNPSFLTGSLR